MTKKRFISKPLQLIILQPTSFCNISCEYCYLTVEGRNTKGIMALDVFEAACRNIFMSELSTRSDSMNFTWHSGEPLVAPIEFYKNAIELIHKYNTASKEIINQIVTNATLINENWCKFFKEYNIAVAVSVDGPKFLHDHRRKKRNGLGSFEDAIRGINLLNKYNIPFYTLTTITDKTLDYPNELFCFYNEIGSTEVGLNFEEATGFNKNTSLDQAQAIDKTEDFIRALYSITKKQTKIKIREFESVLGFVFFGEEYDSVHSNSVSPFSILNIDKFGNFGTFSQELIDLKHDRFDNFILGNVKHDKIDDAYTSPKLLAIYDEIVKGVEACSETCGYFDVCGGGMPSSKLSANNSNPSSGRFDATETLFCKLSVQKVADIIISDMEGI